MSDDYPAFYNAWIAIMPAPANHILCAWHVLHSWERNFKLIRDNELREQVKQKLSVIMKITEVSVFEVEYERY